MSVSLKNCINCGAPLDGAVREYCGTSYRDEEKEPLGIDLDDTSLRGTMKILGMTFDVNVREINTEYISAEDIVGRGADGKMRVRRRPPVTTFTLEGMARE